jgi:hypothetical protein
MFISGCSDSQMFLKNAGTLRPHEPLRNAEMGVTLLSSNKIPPRGNEYTFFKSLYLLKTSLGVLKVVFVTPSKPIGCL